jgi:hypothetical protein
MAAESLRALGLGVLLMSAQLAQSDEAIDRGR